MRFRPALIPSVALVGALFILVNLSAWQARRHFAQQAHLADVSERLHALKLDASALSETGPELGWHHAALTGTWAGPVQLIVGAYANGKPGYRLVQTLKTGNGTILVDRGWVPLHDTLPVVTAATPADTVTIDGLLMTIEPAASASKADEDIVPGALVWHEMLGTWLGYMPQRLGPPWAAMAAAADVSVAQAYLIAGPERTKDQAMPSDEPPIGGYVAIPHQIGHLSYAYQWAFIALTAVGVWVYAGFKRGERLSASKA